MTRADLERFALTLGARHRVDVRADTLELMRQVGRALEAMRARELEEIEAERLARLERATP